MKYLFRKSGRNSYLFLALLLSFKLTWVPAQTSSLHVLNIKTSKDLHQFFKYTGPDIPLISGHRGGTTKGYPENCIATFENTLRHTPAFFEIDPRLTKDSVVVLMHDATLNRTTTGTGKVSDYTWAELKQLRLKDADGNVTAYAIPTLDEVIAWSKGKTILNLDKKDVPLAMTARKLREHQAETHVMLTVHSAEQAKFYLNANKNQMFSAFIRNRKEFEDYEKAGIPWSQLMAYVGPTNKPENKEMYDLLHARGVKCMISAAPSYDKLPDPAARKNAYQEIIKAGADVLESDLPIEAAAAVQMLQPAKSTKAKYFGKK
ncbi:MAG: glycerophosphodiester phosphodiesterase [Cytophagales bacterium CG18_big_fil_WC_8_21_14_2_50_42_9]|nr:MAG: glycerophosphodiester phosphodiesterase [Cytophagales bacterium CG18_big_fil_WC_8_21_14_2_50_42_9]